MLFSIAHHSAFLSYPKIRAAYDPLFVWEVMTVSKEKGGEAIAARNDYSGFIVFSPLSWLMVVDPDHFHEALRAALHKEGIPPSQIDRYIALGSETRFTQMGGGYEREKLKAVVDAIEGRTIGEVRKTINRERTVIRNRSVIPSCMMAQALKDLPSEMVDPNELEVEVNVTLALKSSPPPWRRFALDSTLALSLLPTIIRIGFGWCADKEHGLQASDVNSHDDQLQAALLHKRRLTYTAGVNQRWTIAVELVAIKRRGEGASPRCIAGSYAAPLEDLGGERDYTNKRVSRMSRQTLLFPDSDEESGFDTPFDKDGINKALSAWAHG